MLWIVCCAAVVRPKYHTGQNLKQKQKNKKLEHYKLWGKAGKIKLVHKNPKVKSSSLTGKEKPSVRRVSQDCGPPSNQGTNILTHSERSQPEQRGHCNATRESVLPLGHTWKTPTPNDVIALSEVRGIPGLRVKHAPRPGHFHDVCENALWPE